MQLQILQTRWQDYADQQECEISGSEDGALMMVALSTSEMSVSAGLHGSRSQKTVFFNKNVFL